VYTVKSVKAAPVAVVWSTKRQRSMIQVDSWKKNLSSAHGSSSNWPNKPGTKDGGWALSPLTLDSSLIHRGEGGQTKSGLQWKLESTENESGHKIGKIAFSNLPTGNVLLDPTYVDAVTNRMKALKHADEWSFPTTGWKTTHIEDKVDISTGIPTSMELEQVRSGGFKLKTLITMTPTGK
jgi:hypothetical protein